MDATSDAFSFDNMGVLPDCDYTSIPCSPMNPFFDTPVVPSTEPQTCKPFADVWTTQISMLTGPLGAPGYNLPNVSVNSSIETVNVNDVFTRDMSPAPSLCVDGDYSSAHSPPSLKRSFSSSSESSSGNDEDYNEAPAAKHPKRRPRRPRLERTSSTSSTSSSSKTQQQRVPHNQAERKYREGLNAQLEQLRRAVPTLCQVNDAERGKPNKATVLVGAIAYIKSIERERDELASEVERRRMSDGTVRVEGWS
ncbi:hypothetical protein GQ44DRAFT_23575 [Phaeosphaeriaceae sp. PMI808]|nr:hypothetical protein GQ44DRAFT_23575 [Phaeosphaeriaceae sp. PMI808]